MTYNFNYDKNFVQYTGYGQSFGNNNAKAAETNQTQEKQILTLDGVFNDLKLGKISVDVMIEKLNNLGIAYTAQSKGNMTTIEFPSMGKQYKVITNKEIDISMAVKALRDKSINSSISGVKVVDVNEEESTTLPKDIGTVNSMDDIHNEPTTITEMYKNQALHMVDTLYQNLLNDPEKLQLAQLSCVTGITVSSQEGIDENVLSSLKEKLPTADEIKQILTDMVNSMTFNEMPTEEELLKYVQYYISQTDILVQYRVYNDWQEILSDPSVMTMSQLEQYDASLSLVSNYFNLETVDTDYVHATVYRLKEDKTLEDFQQARLEENQQHTRNVVDDIYTKLAEDKSAWINLQMSLATGTMVSYVKYEDETTILGKLPSEGSNIAQISTTLNSLIKRLVGKNINANEIRDMLRDEGYSNVNCTVADGQTVVTYREEDCTYTLNINPGNSYETYYTTYDMQKAGLSDAQIEKYFDVIVTEHVKGESVNNLVYALKPDVEFEADVILKNLSETSKTNGVNGVAADGVSSAGGAKAAGSAGSALNTLTAEEVNASLEFIVSSLGDSYQTYTQTDLMKMLVEFNNNGGVEVLNNYADRYADTLSNVMTGFSEYLQSADDVDYTVDGLRDWATNYLQEQYSSFLDDASAAEVAQSMVSLIIPDENPEESIFVKSIANSLLEYVSGVTEENITYDDVIQSMIGSSSTSPSNAPGRRRVMGLGLGILGLCTNSDARQHVCNNVKSIGEAWSSREPGIGGFWNAVKATGLNAADMYKTCTKAGVDTCTTAMDKCAYGLWSKMNEGVGFPVGVAVVETTISWIVKAGVTAFTANPLLGEIASQIAEGGMAAAEFFLDVYVMNNHPDAYVNNIRNMLGSQSSKWSDEQCKQLGFTLNMLGLAVSLLGSEVSHFDNKQFLQKWAGHILGGDTSFTGILKQELKELAGNFNLKKNGQKFIDMVFENGSTVLQQIENLCSGLFGGYRTDNKIDKNTKAINGTSGTSNSGNTNATGTSGTPNTPTIPSGIIPGGSQKPTVLPQNNPNSSTPNVTYPSGITNGGSTTPSGSTSGGTTYNPADIPDIDPATETTSSYWDSPVSNSTDVQNSTNTLDIINEVSDNWSRIENLSSDFDKNNSSSAYLYYHNYPSDKTIVETNSNIDPVTGNEIVTITYEDGSVCVEERKHDGEGYTVVSGTLTDPDEGRSISYKDGVVTETINYDPITIDEDYAGGTTNIQDIITYNENTGEIEIKLVYQDGTTVTITDTSKNEFSIDGNNIVVDERGNYTYTDKAGNTVQGNKGTGDYTVTNKEGQTVKTGNTSSGDRIEFYGDGSYADLDENGNGVYYNPNGSINKTVQDGITSYYDPESGKPYKIVDAANNSVTNIEYAADGTVAQTIITNTTKSGDTQQIIYGPNGEQQGVILNYTNADGDRVRDTFGPNGESIGRVVTNTDGNKTTTTEYGADGKTVKSVQITTRNSDGSSVTTDDKGNELYRTYAGIEAANKFAELTGQESVSEYDYYKSTCHANGVEPMSYMSYMAAKAANDWGRHSAIAALASGLAGGFGGGGGSSIFTFWSGDGGMSIEDIHNIQKLMDPWGYWEYELMKDTTHLRKQGEGGVDMPQPGTPEYWAWLAGIPYSPPLEKMGGTPTQEGIETGQLFDIINDTFGKPLKYPGVSFLYQLLKDKGYNINDFSNLNSPFKTMLRNKLEQLINYYDEFNNLYKEEEPVQIYNTNGYLCAVVIDKSGQDYQYKFMSISVEMIPEEFPAKNEIFVKNPNAGNNMANENIHEFDPDAKPEDNSPFIKFNNEFINTNSIIIKNTDTETYKYEKDGITEIINTDNKQGNNGNTVPTGTSYSGNKPDNVDTSLLQTSGNAGSTYIINDSYVDSKIEFGNLFGSTNSTGGAGGTGGVSGTNGVVADGVASTQGGGGVGGAGGVSGSNGVVADGVASMQGGGGVGGAGGVSNANGVVADGVASMQGGGGVGGAGGVSNANGVVADGVASMQGGGGVGGAGGVSNANGVVADGVASMQGGGGVGGAGGVSNANGVVADGVASM